MPRTAREARGRRARAPRRRTGPGEGTAGVADVIEDRRRGWWSMVMAGQLEQTHPVYGPAIRVRFDHDVVVVRGALRTKEQVDDLRRELRRLSKPMGVRVRFEVTLAPSPEAEEGLLEQTLIGVYETKARAEFAVRLLEEHIQVRPRRMTLLHSPDVSNRAAQRVIPKEYRVQAREALKAGHYLLAVTVDEVHAFKARELLDQETRSLMTLALPPQLPEATAS